MKEVVTITDKGQAITTTTAHCRRYLLYLDN